MRAIEGIKNQQGEQIWRWLGWSIGDFMHWQINVPEWRLEVDWNTVPGSGVEDTMNMTAFVNAAFDAGNPAVQGSRQYWLDLAASDPNSLQFYDLWKAALTPVTWESQAPLHVEYVQVVKDVS